MVINKVRVTVKTNTQNQNPFFYYRFIAPGSIMQAAVTFMEAERRKEYDRSDPNRGNLFITLHRNDLPDDLKEVSDKNILEDLVDRKVQPKGSFRSRDRNLMTEFIKRNHAEFLPNLKIDIRGYMSGRAPLLSYLQAEAQGDHTNWWYPAPALIEDLSDAASIDQNSTKLTVKEVTIGVNSDEEFYDFDRWVMSQHKDNQDKFPSGLTSLDIEEIKIRKSSFTLLKNKVAQENTRPIRVAVPGFNESNCTNIPAKIMFGDGRKWMGIIRFNWKMEVNRDGIRTYVLDTSKIEEPHVAFFTIRQLKYLTGQGILNDRNGLQDFLKTIYNIDVQLPKCIEMDSISHAAGYRLRKSGMFTTNLTVMGGLLNKEVSCADGMWCEEYHKLPAGFQAYLIGDVRVGYTNSIVLLSLLMRNIFPDPHVLCTVLQLNQKEAVRWFCDLVVRCLSELGINPDEKFSSETRQELVNSLRGYTDTYPRKMTARPPPQTRVFAKLIPDWPTVPYGGARELHQVVAFFVEQYRTLQELVAFDRTFQEHTPANLHQDVNEDLIRIITYGRGTQREIMCPGATLFNLQVREQNKTFIFTGDFSNEAIAKESKRIGRPSELAILETIRVFPSARTHLFFCLSFFNLYKREYSFWLTRLTLYDRIKSMMSILNDKTVPGIPALEAELRSRAMNVISQETTARKKDEIIVQNRIRRETLMAVKNERNQRFSGTKRTALQQDVYKAIPGDTTIKNQKARRNKKRRMEYMRRLDDFVEQEEWEHMKRTGKNPSRASFKNYKQCEYDLRDVLKQTRNKQAVKQDLAAERQAQKGTTYSKSQIQGQKYNQDDLRTVLKLNREEKTAREDPAAARQAQKGTTYSTTKVQDRDQENNQPGPSQITRTVTQEERTIRVIEISEDEEMETTEGHFWFAAKNQYIMSDTSRAHFMDPRITGVADRTPVDITQTAKWTGKGKGKGKGKSNVKTAKKIIPHPEGLSSSESEYHYECDFE